MPDFERRIGDFTGSEIPLIISKRLHDDAGNGYLIDLNQTGVTIFQIIEAGGGNANEGLDVIFEKLEVETEELLEDENS